MTATACSQLWFNGTNLLVANAGAWNLNRSALTTSPRDIAGTVHQELAVYGVDQTISVPAMYSDAVAKQIARIPQGENFVFAAIVPPNETPFWCGGKCFVDGVDTTASTEDSISKSVVFRPSEVWARGFSVDSFTQSAADTADRAIDKAANTDKAYLVIHENDPGDGTRNITVGGAALSVKLGVYELDTALSNFNIEYAAAGSVVLSGVVLQGSTFAAPEDEVS